MTRESTCQKSCSGGGADGEGIRRVHDDSLLCQGIQVGRWGAGVVPSYVVDTLLSRSWTCCKTLAYMSFSPKSSAKMKIMSGFSAEAVLSSHPRIAEKSLIFALPAFLISWRGHSEPSIWSGSGQTGIFTLDLRQSSSSSSISPISRQSLNFL